ncbi:hypothetical protein WJX72_005393 [[Myrmecia] bisecta]|uniref:NRDE family protein n=1 Tax=[Myrmecia] bisecta TaxID=41462 RepID=A0AAW1QF32_9CHLO
MKIESLEAHPTLLLLLAFNRDEYFDRDTYPAAFWEELPDLLAGRDKERGGTWLGITRTGRFALLTNIRVAPSEFRKDTLSRGLLTTAFLTGSTPPLEYLQNISVQDYNGFNLVVGDLRKQQHRSLQMQP